MERVIYCDKDLVNVRELTDPQKQKIADKLVRREVIECVSYMISEVSRVSHDLGIEDELCTLLEGSDPLDEDDYEQVATDEGWQRFTKLSPKVQAALIKNEEVDEASKCETFLIVDMDEDSVPTVDSICIADNFEELCDIECLDMSVAEEENRYEIYEHWSISSFLADKLRERGETVEELLGFIVWGRGTTNQAICLDRSIQQIAITAYSFDLR